MKYYIWTYAWTITILVLCLLPPSEFGNTSRFFEGADKLVHTGLFFVFTVLLFFASIHAHPGKYSKWVTCLRVTTISVFFAMLTEFLQWKVFTYRTGDFWDVLANLIGIGMGCFAFLLIYRKSND